MPGVFLVTVGARSMSFYSGLHRGKEQLSYRNGRLRTKTEPRPIVADRPAPRSGYLEGLIDLFQRFPTASAAASAPDVSTSSTYGASASPPAPRWSNYFVTDTRFGECLSTESWMGP